MKSKKFIIFGAAAILALTPAIAGCANTVSAFGFREVRKNALVNQSVTLSVQSYASANSWANGTKYTTINLNEAITAKVIDGGGNSGKYYTSGHEWRLYQTETPTLRISVSDSSKYNIVSITLSYNVANTGILKDGNNDVTSGTTVNVNATSKDFTIGNSGTATNGQVKITNFSVAYTENVASDACVITFDTDGGSQVPNQNVSNDGSSTVEEPDNPEKKGYNFAGWYTDSNFENPYDFNSPVTKSFTLYAKWEKVAPTESYSNDLAENTEIRIIGEVIAKTNTSVYFIQSGNNSMYVYDQTSAAEVVVGNTIDLFGTTSKFNGLTELTNILYYTITSDDTTIDQTPLTSLDDVTSENLFKYVEISNIVLSEDMYTNNNNNLYSAAIESENNLKLYANNANFVNGGDFDYTEYKAGNYVRVSGLVYQNKTQMEIFFTNISKMQQYTITFETNGGTEIAPASVLEGERLNAPIVPSKPSTETTNYQFGGWYTDENCNQEYNFETIVTESFTLYAKWIESTREASDVITKDLTTNSSLSYNYTIEGEGYIDTLNQAFTGITGTSYSSWTKKSISSKIDYAGNNAGSNGSIQLRSSNNNSGIVSTSESAQDLSKVKITWESSTSAGRIVEIYGKNEAYQIPSDLYHAEKQGDLLGSLNIDDATNNVSELTVNGSYKYIGIRSKSGALYLSNIDIQWGTPKTISYSDTAIRFGGLLKKDIWDNLNTQHTIVGYGVMLSTDEYLDSFTFNDWYDLAADGKASIDEAIAEACDGTNVKNFYTQLSESKTSPALANAEQTNNAEEDYYVWNLYKKVGNNFTTSYRAVAYIRTSESIVFFKETSASAKSLAQSLIDNGTYTDDAFEGSLANLANIE